MPNAKTFDTHRFQNEESIILRDYEFQEKLLSGFKRKVWVNGCFDLLHWGHLRTIRTAIASGDCLIVGVNSDNSVRRLKGKNRPILTESERALALAQIPGVNYVIIFEDDSPKNIIARVKPNLVLKDEQYRTQNYPELAVLKEIMCEVTYLSKCENISSTEIERRIVRANLNEN